MGRMKELYIETMEKHFDRCMIADKLTIWYNNTRWYIDHKNKMIVDTNDTENRMPFVLLPDSLRLE